MLKKSLAFKAAKSKKRAKRGLFEKYKNQIYNLLIMLIDDEEKAAKITVEVFSMGFEKIKNSDIKEDEEFYKTVVNLAVIRSIPFLNLDLKGNIKGEDTSPLDIEKEKYVGEVREGYKYYSGAFSKLEELSKVLIVLYFCGRLNEEEIGRLLKIRRTNIISKLKTAVEEFSIHLENLGAGGIRKDIATVNQLRSFYREYAKTIKLPECLEDKKKSKNQAKRKRI